ncbi:MAG: UDP-N-acetylmuramate:L-alanyl-gamma-D-glutamyl-meso-diaminopimelate ligase [Gammaproteobacteria bacterium]|nr:UDP-N-acetylmuramate:L-alanyl-gamma-D-glutamyl-meso-diaminopimelate ligase [Gammaproteobacteria bacterium]MDH5226489.1 UDP-N-acetylmuramate:L-alanyl-gamma-D-glutamyl-meso-diaminopimelate ligase [Gammaproteobacteria bacterium]
MHLHILGVCGTFMGGIAAIARAAGHRVTGSDRNVYPPMSTQLAALGIDVIEGYEPDQLKLNPDVFVVGNVMSRGNALVEALLDSGKRYESGPDWLARNVLQADERWVLGVAGTHGKTTTSSLLAWILEHAGLQPGFLIGGVPLDFDVSARLGQGRHFVIEADEYDTAFFDKRAKFVHYRPRTAILNNLEHDHADIYPDVAAIQKQFHLLLRTVPRNGRLLVNADEPYLEEVLQMGCWTPVERFSSTGTATAEWRVVAAGGDASYASFEIWRGARCLGRVDWDLLGRHNAANAVAAVAAACHAGVDETAALEALRRFGGVKRRLEVRGVVRDITVYDDFAHHPTAIATTLDGVRRRAGKGRVFAVLEPRSNTMKLGTHKAALARSLTGADRVFVYQSPEVKWDVTDAMRPLGALATVQSDLALLIAGLAAEARPGDHLVLMSNGSFGGLHDKLLQGLRDATP